MSTHQRDYNGKEFIMHLYDENDLRLDESYLREGDYLEDEKVYKSTHEGGGNCVKCGYSTFFINGGKEYCGLCNEFFDTYKFMRESAGAAMKQERETKSIMKAIEKARREGDFTRVKELEQVLIWTQMDSYKLSYIEHQEELERQKLQAQHRAQNAYLAKKLNHMQNNKAQYYDIP